MYLYLSFGVVNDIRGSVGRLEVAVFALPDGGDHLAPGVGVAVLRGQAGAGVQQLLVAGRALLLAAVTSLVIMNLIIVKLQSQMLNPLKKVLLCWSFSNVTKGKKVLVSVRKN